MLNDLAHIEGKLAKIESSGDFVKNLVDLVKKKQVQAAATAAQPIIGPSRPPEQPTPSQALNTDAASARAISTATPKTNGETEASHAAEPASTVTAPVPDEEHKVRGTSAGQETNAIEDTPTTPAPEASASPSETEPEKPLDQSKS